MASETTTANGSTLGLESFDLPHGAFSRSPSVIIFTCLLAVIPLAMYIYKSGPKTTLPFINEGPDAVKRFEKNARALIAEGFRKYSGPFNIMTSSGPIVLLPPEHIEAVNSNTKLSSQESSAKEHLTYLITFRTFRPSPPHQMADALLKGLTRSLPKFTKPLSDEMTSCLDRSWGVATAWHVVDSRVDTLDWVSRLSVRVFIGERLAGNEEWLKISRDFTVDSFAAIDQLHYRYPSFLRPIADKFLPICKRVRAQHAAAKRILDPIIEERRAEIAAAAQEDRKPDLPDDSIEWFRNASKGRSYDDLELQLLLTIAAIHTTSDLINQAMLNLALHPEYCESLRKEALEVLNKYGWQKNAITELRLLDSFLKETQRVKPIALAAFNRTACEDVVLSDGTKIHKGERIFVSNHRMWSEEIYPNADKFDAFRFYDLRQVAGNEHKFQLAATSLEHTGFAHGKGACPGRFFAANEAKIAMIHVLLKYDLKLDDPKDAQWAEQGVDVTVNPQAKLQVKRRDECIDLDKLQVDN